MIPITPDVDQFMKSLGITTGGSLLQFVGCPSRWSPPGPVRQEILCSGVAYSHFDLYIGGDLSCWIPKRCVFPFAAYRYTSRTAFCPIFPEGCQLESPLLEVEPQHGATAMEPWITDFLDPRYSNMRASSHRYDITYRIFSSHVRLFCLPSRRLGACLIALNLPVACVSGRARGPSAHAHVELSILFVSRLRVIDLTVIWYLT
jgi:hypothetical protein